ncbi:MAG: carboxypeptidase regulatory-like domain-containing protein [Acidobacteriota bacterium]
MSIALVELLIAGLLLTSPANERPRVVDAAGQPIESARIRIDVAPTTTHPLTSLLQPALFTETDRDGRWNREAPRYPDVYLVVDHPDHLPITQRTTTDPLPSPLRLEPGARLVGTLTPPASHTVRTAEVCVSWYVDPPVDWADPRRFERCRKTDDEEFMVPGLPETTPLDVRVRAEGFVTSDTVVVAAAEDGLRTTTIPLELGIPLTGRVVDVDGRAVPDATVSITHQLAHIQSNAEGHFTLIAERLPATVEARAPGQRPTSRPVDDADTPILLTLEPSQGIAGHVTQPNDEPVRGFELRIEHHDTSTRRSFTKEVTPDDEGRFTVDLRDPGRYHLSAGGNGWRSRALEPVEIDPGTVVDLGTVHLDPGASIRGTVRDERSNEPLDGVEVSLVPQGHALLDQLTDRRFVRRATDADGSFTLAGLDAGRYELRARRPGYAPTTDTLDLFADDSLDLDDVWLGQGTTLGGAVRDRAGSPRGDVTVRVLDVDGATLLPRDEALTDADGRFTGLRLAPGRYRLRIESGGKRLGAREIEIIAGEKERHIELEVGGVEVRGRVQRGDTPVAGAAVSITSALDPGPHRGKMIVELRGGGRYVAGAGDSAVFAITDTDGYFVARDVSAGAAWLRAQSGGDEANRRLVVPANGLDDVVLDLASASRGGTVLSAATGDPIAGATIHAVHEDGLLAGRARTATDGSFTLTADGLLRLSVYADGHATVSRDLAATERDVTLTLERRDSAALANAALDVALQRSDGSPLASVMTTVLDTTGVLAAAKPLDRLGRQRFTGLAAGTYFVVWSDPLAGIGVGPALRLDDEPVSFAHTVAIGGPLTLTCDPSWCTGTVLELLTVHAANGVEIGRYLPGLATHLSVADDGRLHLGRLAPGTYRVRARIGGRDATATLAAGPAGATLVID